ncbi:hypothetical protein N3K66_000155 [Trichothecium roseum]|uniref:Uncharacterized protein n=1 Tax=Trichothecium roseum TaxID=47278 RepID=A0ACC0VB04_9HYPO|nr:hypothetical protein N3K66_000155 [Trichothecium roseum]
MDADWEVMQVDHDEVDMDPQDSEKQQQLAADTEIWEQRLADEQRLRLFTEQVLDSRQQELEAQEALNAQLMEKMEALKKELEAAKIQLAEARISSQSKAQQLSDAQDQIFRLQSTRRDITESEAQEKYRLVVGNVQRWVENRLTDILDDLDSDRIRTKASQSQASRIVSLMRESAKRCIPLSRSDEYHIIAVIMNYLWFVFFSKSFYCPLDDLEGDTTLAWLDEVGNSMSRLPRDESQCREWRCEALTAITSQATFKTRRNRYLDLVTADLAEVLKLVVPLSDPDELHESLRRTIIEPAADLVHDLHLSPSIYSLKWPARGAWSRLEVYECLNISSGGLVLDLSGTNSSSPSRKKVRYMFDVAPGLFVERVEGGKKMALKAICRPTVLVHSVREAPRARQLKELGLRRSHRLEFHQGVKGGSI